MIDFKKSFFKCITRYLSKATVRLDWIHLYKHATVIIVNWLTITKYMFLKWPWIVCFLCRFPPSLSPEILFPYLTMWVKQWLSYKKQEHLGLPPIFVAHIFSFLFCLSLICVLCLVLAVSLDCQLLLVLWFSNFYEGTFSCNLELSYIYIYSVYLSYIDSIIHMCTYVVNTYMLLWRNYN